MDPTALEVVQPVAAERLARSAGFWTETWRRFRRRKLSMLALAYVVFLAFVAVFAPAIAGTKPVVVKYKGKLYYPSLGYLRREWENPVFFHDKFRGVYPVNLEKNDPEYWAIWPLVYQDPYRRVRDGEWTGRQGNPHGDQGRPYVYYLWLKAWDRVFGTNHTTGVFGEKEPPFNLFGTDQRGVDVFAQMVHGARIAMLVGFVSMGIAAMIGITVGATAGYFGGWTDALLSRVIELVMCVPSLVLILSLIAILEKTTIWHLMAIIGITSWTGIARLTRGEFLKLKELEYVQAARALGASQARIMFLHILRNALAPILVPITFGIAAAILIESGLSYLGFGASPPNPSWGTLLNEGRVTIQQTWWLIFFPGLAIFLTVLCYNVIGEGLQEATDPRLRQASH